MCAYVREWYGFSIDSKRHIMDLEIAPSFKRVVCTQFHEMENGEYRAFYNFEPPREVFFAKIKRCNEENKGETNKTLAQTCAGGLFREDCPVKEFTLSIEERQLVDRLYEQELPEDVEKSYGLDGHSYLLTLYKDRPIEYRSWAVVPKEWNGLTEVINMVIYRIDLDEKNYGVYKSGIVIEQGSENLEIPEFLLKNRFT